MIINGVNLDEVTPDIKLTFPSLVEGRVLQLDGDALGYKCTYNDSEPFATARNNYLSSVEMRRNMSGSSSVNIHLTGKNKGGRYKLATVKEYQASRKNKVKPKNLHLLREYLMDVDLALAANVIMHENQEADDGMAQGNFWAIQAGTPQLSAIMAEDKDLTMCSGLHCDWNTFEITMVEGFGSIYLDTSTKTKKIKGFGTSFFWAQLLMGDPADTIPGLEKVGGDILEVVKPGKKPNPKRKPGLIGPALTWEILKDCKTDHEAMLKVLACYNSFYPAEYTYTAWDGTEITRRPVQMLYEQAQLLWMRRVEGEQPNVFFKGVIEGSDWRTRIEEKLQP